MATASLNTLCTQSVPFFFLSDFEGKDLACYPLDTLADEDIEFAFHATGTPHDTQVEKQPIGFEPYKEKLLRVQEYIRNGDTYLLNLTQPTPIECSDSLHTIYAKANAPFKLRFKDQFVCFSPEKFIEIIDDRIYTYPMKGTIDASLPHAEETILSDEKEMAEHLMVVDLLRNDLGIVATNIQVEKFRYIDRIKAGTKKLLQVSSKISGKLESTWPSRIEEILHALLPAGSISGTPKKRTVEIIKEVEGYQRGFFTGVFGYFDGKDLYSAVSIRFIENTPSGHVYKSGGGITIDSDAQKEYEELIDKIYIP
ncbi:aminodeoxychorismate synthase component I [Sulfurimonas sp. HSL-3221]|uniref:aminodeoxychorismate synthase component I n=1 Tax=Thiomicrolovo sulfuroxydans TaxID=2894755 RepID=UPI001E6346DE|nr:aminodeoxychorismate synthase component I [Sulfurimonas sp. HSL-3221]UFS62181.1 aminodeoxychorismate synthase component I [Sulfurimonas sp. HSL-3221]